MKPRDVKLTFTPYDKRYLGRESVHAFDQLIVACLESNSHVAPKTHTMEKDELQWAACQIIPFTGTPLNARDFRP